MSPRAGLDREAVVRTAVELADRAGGEITLSALASHLGVRSPSLYNHVAGQEGLSREMALVGIRELSTGITKAAVGKSADDALLSIAHAYRDFASQHPGIYPLTQRAPDPDDADLQAAAGEVVDVLAAVMESFNLREDESIHAIRGLRSLLHGFVTLEAAGGFGIPIDVEESFDRSARTFISGLHEAPAEPAV